MNKIVLKFPTVLSLRAVFILFTVPSARAFGDTPSAFSNIKALVLF